MYNDPNQPNQPPYNQPSQPYGQPGGYGQPPQYAESGIPIYEAPAPPKKSRKTLWIVLSIVGGILVLSCAVCGLVFAGVIKIGTQVAGPALAISSYYEDLKTQNYAQAYTYLDPQLLIVQGQAVTVDLYTSAEETIDEQFGPVNNFSLTNIQVQNDSATIAVRETRTQTRDITYTLQRVGNNWKISGVKNAPTMPTGN
jgi:hypothetical protein